MKNTDITLSKKLLIPSQRLKQALRNFAIRNQLMSDLSQTEGNAYNTNQQYRHILSLWLGSSIQLSVNKDSFTPSEILFIAKAGHLIILAIERQMSLIDKKSQFHKALDHARYQLLSLLNHEYSSLTLMPDNFIKKITFILIDLDKSHSELRYRSQKEILVENFSHLILIEKSEFNPNIINALSEYNHTSFSPSVWMMRFITGSFDKLYYENISLCFWVQQSTCKKIMINNNGIILEGLVCQENIKPTDSITLALIGHFQTEHHYLSDGYYHFANTFGDIVLINHRNYSNRSTQYATNNIELAEDVVAFYQYFKPRYKQIVLYGMCGGAAQMILAASILQKSNKPFHLIVDRFTESYSTIALHPSHIYLCYRHLIYPVSNLNFSIKQLIKTLLIPILFKLFLHYLIKVLLIITQNNQSFSQILKTLPREKVLTLTVKSKVKNKDGFPIDADFYATEKYDLRNTFKPERKKMKMAAREIMQHLSEIHILLESTQHALTPLFESLRIIFYNCIQLIDSEKLFYSYMTHLDQTDVKASDRHSEKIYSLQPRYIRSISTFIHGFFTPPSTNLTTVISQLKPVNEVSIYFQLDSNNNKKDAESLHRASTMIAEFFALLHEHQSDIIPLINRLEKSGFDDPTPHFTQLAKLHSNAKRLEPTFK